MGCSNCSTQNGQAKGCRSNGGCSSGGCNRLNTFDWLARYDYDDPQQYFLTEVSFKQGGKKDFFRNVHNLTLQKGDFVVVDTGTGWDVGMVSLFGTMAQLQMKKKRISEHKITNMVQRLATARDLEKMHEARDMEQSALVRSRAIARTLGLDMKVGDVQYQADLKKATFYYTAEGRVDFRELVRSYAREFAVKVEMRQIGARQESARIGGLGPCGRELCCSTWLSDFKSVSTLAARYQNLAINQAKLSGQCGRLKCCLNYELDTYLEALDQFPKDVDEIPTKRGKAVLVKLDIFKNLMYFALDDEVNRGKIIPLDMNTVWDIKQNIDRGALPEDLSGYKYQESEEIETLDFADGTGEIELPNTRNKKRKNKRGERQNRYREGDSRERNERSERYNQENRRDKPADQQQTSRTARSDAPRPSAPGAIPPTGSSDRDRQDRNRQSRDRQNARHRDRQRPEGRDQNQQNRAHDTDRPQNRDNQNRDSRNRGQNRHNQGGRNRRDRHRGPKGDQPDQNPKGDQGQN